jgi:glycosyltransferase involved in cell wall biosynthesis
VRRRDDLILVVATLEPRKNARFVLDWFLSSRAVPPGMRLCWVGPPGWLPALGESPPASNRVTFPGVVSDAELCRLYREATFTVYASLYEGFGFPVLDSLAHGCPVAASYNSSLVELESPGVFYFDPGDPATLDDACRDLLAARPTLSIDRAELDRRFSWRAMAREVVRRARAGRLACAS